MKWNGLLKIREQRVSQAQRSLAAARAKEAECEAACAQVKQQIENLQRALQYNSLTTTNQRISLDCVLAGQQHRQRLQQEMEQEMTHLQQAEETLNEAQRVSADKAADYLLMQRKQENAQQELRNEQRVTAQRAIDVEEELAIEQWLANDLPG